MMGDSADSMMQRGLNGLLDKADAKLEELLRWARVSFSLQLQEYDSSTILVMQYCTDYSRKKDLLLPKLILGFVPTSVVKNYEPCSQKNIRSIGRAIKRNLSNLETVPLVESERAQWTEESYDGHGKLPVPAAIHGIDCFQRILDKDGAPYAPPALHTYRTNDPESRAFLEKLVL